MLSLFSHWINLIQSHYISPVDRRRGISLTILNGVALAIVILNFLARYVLPGAAGSLNIGSIVPVLIALPLIIVSQRMLLDGNLRQASLLFVLMVGVVTLLPRLPGMHGTSAITFLIPLIAAGVLLGRRDFMIVLMVVLVTALFAALAQTQLNDPVTYIPSELVIDDLLLVMISITGSVVLLLVFGGAADAITQDYIQYGQRLEWLTTLRDHMGQAEDVDNALVQVSDVIVSRLLYTFSQTHLLDNDGRLNTYKRTGLGTRHTVVRADFHIENAIRVAARIQQQQFITSNDAYEKRSHLLPSVNYALAIPLVAHGQTIGVLDVQSNADQNPFNDSEVRILNLLATELANTVYEMHQQADLQRVLDEQQRLNERLQADLVKLRRDAQQHDGDTTYFAKQNQVVGFNAVGQNMTLTPANDLPEHLRAAMQQGDVLIEKRGNDQVINLPILRRDEVLGAMSFVVPSSRVLSQRQIEMARSVSNRLAIALENVQLVEQSRAQANRERKAGEVSNLLLGQQEVSRLLETAAESFQEALGAVYTRIYVAPDALREGAR